MNPQITQMDADFENKDKEITPSDFVRKIGRPSKYDPETHPYQALEAMSQGASKAELCIEMCINPLTLVYWQDHHEDFLVAIKIGELLSRAWWIKQGRVNVSNRDFNFGLYIIMMRNMHGWRGKDHDGPPASENYVTNNILIQQIKDNPEQLETVQNLLKEVTNVK